MFRCQYCNKRLSSQYHLNQHIAGNVCRKPDRTCPLCENVFESKRSCQYHMANNVCQKQLENKLVLKPILKLKSNVKSISTEVNQKPRELEGQSSSSGLPSQDLSHNTNEHVYLLREREFIRTNEPIFKIGKTTQKINRRFSGYPKNSEIYFVLKVTCCDTFETSMIRIFDQKFHQETTIGREYYRGDISHMIQTIVEIYQRTETTSLDTTPILSSFEKDLIILDYSRKIHTCWSIWCKDAQIRDRSYQALLDLFAFVSFDPASSFINQLKHITTENINETKQASDWIKSLINWIYLNPTTDKKKVLETIGNLMKTLLCFM